VLSLLSPAAFTWCPAAGRYALKLKEKQRNLARSGFENKLQTVLLAIESKQQTVQDNAENQGVDLQVFKV